MKLSEIKSIGNHIIHLPALERDNTNHLYYNHIAKFIRAYINGLGNKINDNTAYNYIPYYYENLYTICILLGRLGVNKVADLGSGPGLALHVFREHLSLFKSIYTGFEIDKRFVPFGKALGIDIQVKDITKLKVEDISKFEALYMYEPLIEEKLIEKFVKNLDKIMRNDQVIILASAGRMICHFQKYFEIAQIDGTNIYLITKK